MLYAELDKLIRKGPQLLQHVSNTQAMTPTHRGLNKLNAAPALCCVHYIYSTRSAAAVAVAAAAAAITDIGIKHAKLEAKCSRMQSRAQQRS
jgi:hypothetical protein